LVRNLNLVSGPEIAQDPFALIAKLHDGPRTIFNIGDPHRGPSWIPTRAEDIREILQNTEAFSAEESAGFAGVELRVQAS